MPLSSCSSSGDSHQTIEAKIEDMDVFDFGLLQELIDTEKVPVEAFVSGSGDNLIVCLRGFKCYVLWVMHLLGYALARRQTLEESVSLPVSGSLSI